MGLCIKGARNKHLNKCANIWSSMVIVSCLAAVAGAVFMYLNTTHVDDMLDKVRYQFKHLGLCTDDSYKTEAECLDNDEAWSKLKDYDVQGNISSEKKINDLVAGADMVKVVLLALGLGGPVLMFIGMIFFCCQLRALSNEDEGACESCCGTICGCFVFPFVFILAAAISALAIVSMIMFAIFLTNPFAVEVVNDAPKDPMSLLPLLQEGAKGVLAGDMCTQGQYFYDRFGAEKCDQFRLAFLLGFATEMLAAVAAMFGFFMAFCIGYKACCRNKRTDKTDVIEVQPLGV